MTATDRQKRYQKSEQKGRLAEIIILVIYMTKGYWPIARRYKTKYGEIDLIMKKGRLLCFIEVKYRKTPLSHDVPLSQDQWQRLQRTAQLFLARYDKQAALQARFDLAYLSPFFSVKVIKNIM